MKVWKDIFTVAWCIWHKQVLKWYITKWNYLESEWKQTYIYRDRSLMKTMMDGRMIHETELIISTDEWHG